MDFDSIIIGSGFGGSVAALRLAEKGYRVAVLEAGRRFKDEDFPKSNWKIKDFLFSPRLGLKGILRINIFPRLAVLSGAGVGGGSLVYANTLIQPPEESFRRGHWPTCVGVDDWMKELAPHYDVARKMLGVTPAPTDFPADYWLRKTADELGFGATFEPVDVGVFLGEPGVEVSDPYFAGKGPRRRGCIKCGGCMVGCRHNAKNTLEKNYLWLAERLGVKIFPESHVDNIEPLSSGGYRVHIVTPGVLQGGRRQMSAAKIMIAAGTLGSIDLLLRCRDHYRSLPKLSPSIGSEVRTNSESILGVRVPGSKQSFSEGMAITSIVHPNSYTKIEAVRYPRGSDALGVLISPLVSGKTAAMRILATLWEYLRHPLKTIRTQWPPGMASHTIILLVMQSIDSKISLRSKRSWFGLRRMTTGAAQDQAPPVMIAEGVVFAKKLAGLVQGVAKGSKLDLMNSSVTAHILGGCPMGTDKTLAAIDGNHEVYGYPGIYVVGAASIPANLGVNPSLTITAMAERAMSKISPKAGTSKD